MYKDVLRNIENIETWPVISFVIFFAFFIGLLWFTFTADKGFINRMTNMPIDDGTPKQSPESKTETI